MIEMRCSADDFVEIGFGIVVRLCGSGCANGTCSSFWNGRIRWWFNKCRHGLTVAAVAVFVKRCLDESTVKILDVVVPILVVG